MLTRGRTVGAARADAGSFFFGFFCGTLSVSYNTGSQTPARPMSLYKILFHFKALLWDSILLLMPPPHLQSLPDCNTIARALRNIRPPTDPPCVYHTPYNIVDSNIVQMQVRCMSVCKDSAAPAHARARAHRPAAPRQSSGVLQTPHFTACPQDGIPHRPP